MDSTTSHAEYTNIPDVLSVPGATVSGGLTSNTPTQTMRCPCYEFLRLFTDRHILRRRPGAETNAVPVHGTLFSARHYVRPHKAKRLSTSNGGDG